MEFTTIQRQVAEAALARCQRLGARRFNVALGESQRLEHAHGIDVGGMRAWPQALPQAANSGDIDAVAD